eukprot:3942846-Prymnesium_polylepis.1
MTATPAAPRLCCDSSRGLPRSQTWTRRLSPSSSKLPRRRWRPPRPKRVSPPTRPRPARGTPST